EIASPPGKVFEFIVQPKNLALVTPPDFPMELVDPPERIAKGVRLTARVSRFGISQDVVSEVTDFKEGVGWTDAQVSGPLKKFVHSHRLEPTPTGTRMYDRVEFEAPGGLLGFVVTNAKIAKELERTFEYRTQRFRELLES